MNVTQKVEGSCELSVEGELTIYRATEFHELLEEKQTSHQAIILDMENVTEIDTACFQVLLHHKLKSLNQDKKLNLKNCSEPVLDLFQTFGVNGIFINQ